jgi:hypothetical protein
MKTTLAVLETIGGESLGGVSEGCEPGDRPMLQCTSIVSYIRPEAG